MKQTLDLAVEHLENAVRMAPSHSRYAALLGEACLLKGDPDAALAPLQSSFVNEPHPRTAYLMALTLLRLGREAEAERLASAAIEEAEGFHRAYAIRSEAREAQGKIDAAIEDLTEACALCPEADAYRARLVSLRAQRAGDHTVHKTERLTVAWLNPDVVVKSPRRPGKPS